MSMADGVSRERKGRGCTPLSTVAAAVAEGDSFPLPSPGRGLSQSTGRRLYYFNECEGGGWWRSALLQGLNHEVGLA